MSVAEGPADLLPSLEPRGRLFRWHTPNLALVVCVVAAAWLVLVPLAALFLHGIHRGHRPRLRRMDARQFCRGVFRFARAAPVRQLADLCHRLGDRDVRDRRLRRLGGRAHRRAGRRAVPQSGADVVRGAGPADGDGVDFRVQPEHRLGQRGPQIDLRARRRAGQHLLDGRHDLGAVEPLLPARLSRARAGAARARRAHGGGRARLRRALLAGHSQDHAAAAAPRDPVDHAAPVHHGHVVLRGAAADRPAGAHQRFHHRHPGRHHGDAAGVRRRQRAQHHAAGDLHHRRLLLPPRDAPRRSLRHHHRQGLHADARRARPLALAGGDCDRPHLPCRARAAAVHAAVAVVLQQSVAAVHGIERAGNLGELQLRSELPGLPRRGAHQRRGLGHGRDRRRRAHAGDGVDRRSARRRASPGCSMRWRSRRSRSRA